MTTLARRIGRDLDRFEVLACLIGRTLATGSRYPREEPFS